MKEEKRIIPATRDFMFKALFGDKKDTTVLKMFLEDVLELEENSLKKVELMDTHLKNSDNSKKSSVLDVAVKLKDGTQIDIEMQVAPQKDFLDRSLTYATKLIENSIEKGEEYGTINKTIVISVLDFNLFEKEGYYTSASIRDDETYEQIIDKLQLKFLELPKIREMESNEISDKKVDKKILWGMFFISENKEVLEKLQSIDNRFKNPIEKLEKLSNNRDYIREEKARYDKKAQEKFRIEKAEAEGRAEGEAKGRAEGEAKGRAEGEAKGRAEGEAKGRAEMLKKLVKEGVITQEFANEKLKDDEEEEGD